MFVLIAIAVIILSGVALTYSVESSYYQAFKSRLESGFNNWVLREEPTQEEILKYFGDLKKDAYFTFGITEYKTFTIVNGKNNQIIFSNDKMYELDRVKLLGELLRSENFVSAMAGNMGDSDNFLRIDTKVYFDYAIKKGDFVFYFRYDREDWKATVDKFNKIIQISLFVAVCISVVLGFFLSRTITNPIEDLMYRARRIASGDFGEVLEVYSDDEIGKLTGAFNYMSRELKNTLSEISTEKNKIETVLKYMTDGVIAFNCSGEVIHANLAAKRHLGLRYIDFTLDEFSRKYDMGITLSELTEKKASVTRSVDVVIGENILKTYFAVFSDESRNMEGIICVLADITEEKKLESLQRDFVANVSHELKTPLASIKSYTETILDGGVDEETLREFLQIVNSESDRMAMIVRDLLQLSRLDSNRINWNMEEVIIGEIVLDTVQKIRIQAQNKDISLTTDIGEGLTYVIVDGRRMAQVFINILSNAIKYTPNGGEVNVQTGVLDDNVFIRIKDTGIGIPEESISRIFERFYRVDKARSRDMGGTGLGLSIAKEIVEAHGGSISAASEIEKGTEILVMLPASKV